MPRSLVDTGYSWGYCTNPRLSLSSLYHHFPCSASLCIAGPFSALMKGGRQSNCSRINLKSRLSTSWCGGIAIAGTTCGGNTGAAWDGALTDELGCPLPYIGPACGSYILITGKLLPSAWAGTSCRYWIILSCGCHFASRVGVDGHF